MLLPKKTIWRKPHRVKYDGLAKGAKTVSFGEYGLQALQGNWITNNQIEAARVAINRFIKKEGKMWIRIFPHFAKTAKPIQVRMGSGKGNVEKWVAVAKRGTVLFEVGGVNVQLAKKAIYAAGNKLPIKWKFVSKEKEV